MRKGGGGRYTGKPNRFFYVVLKSRNQPEIQKMFSRLRHEAAEIIKGIIRLVYFMRGSVQYEDMMRRTPAERDLFYEFIEERMKSGKGNPYFNM